jgi:predicted SAM-dependent methyltransferase
MKQSRGQRPNRLLVRSHPSEYAKDATIWQQIEQIRREAVLGLHLGCGENLTAGMVNADLYNPSADVKLDCLDLSAYPDASVDLIEHHHMIEHLSYAEAEQGLKEWARVLRLGGHLIITCPELELVLEKWLRSSPSEREGAVLKMIYGSQEGSGMFHCNGFDRTSLVSALERHGFKVEFWHAPFPERDTPSQLAIAVRR